MKNHRMVGATFLVLGAMLLTAEPGPAQVIVGYEGTQWNDEVERMETSLDRGKWSKVKRRAPLLARKIIQQSWYAPDLAQAFARLTFAEAVAEANVGDPYRAVWLWHTAINLDVRTAARDLGSYGAAEKLFLENPLRELDEIPFRFDAAPRGLLEGDSLVYPELIEPEQDPVVLATPVVKTEVGITRPLRLQLIVDEEGRCHQPIVVYPYKPHPAIVWATMRYITKTRFRPAALDGEAVPFLTGYEIGYTVIRGSSTDEAKRPKEKFERAR